MKALNKVPGIILTAVQSGVWYLKTIQKIAQEISPLLSDSENDSASLSGNQ